MADTAYEKLTMLAARMAMENTHALWAAGLLPPEAARLQAATIREIATLFEQAGDDDQASKIWIVAALLEQPPAA